VRDRLRGVDLIIGDEHAPLAERGRSMHERLRTRTWRVEREPEAPQPTRCRPPRRVLAISHGKVFGKPREEHVPALIAGRSGRIREQSLTRPGRLPVILLQELDDQPPSRVEVRLGRDEASKLRRGSSTGNSQPQSSERGPSHTASWMWPLSGQAIGNGAAIPAPQPNRQLFAQLNDHIYQCGHSPLCKR
jgi:hypothetical protein